MLTGIKLSTPYATDQLNIFAKSHMDANPTDDAVAVETAVRAYDTTLQDQRLKESLERMVTNYSLEGTIGGGISSADVTTGGLGYAKNDNIVVAGDGSGANIKVATVDGAGTILALEVVATGAGYTSATLDFTGAGDGLATGTAGFDAITVESETDIISTIVAGL